MIIYCYDKLKSLSTLQQAAVSASVTHAAALPSPPHTHTQFTHHQHYCHPTHMMSPALLNTVASR